MQISQPNAQGVLPAGDEVIVARRGRSTASIHIALCEDGLYRHSVSLHYSYGGFCGPIHIEDPGHPTLAATRVAGLEELLRRWCKPFQSDPQSVRTELDDLRRQVEDQLCQPHLF
jgi:hypothetical protein